MKHSIHCLSVIAALALTPLAAFAADEPRPGKASDGVKEPAVKPADKAAPETTRDSGKSDGEKNAKAGANKFHGKITAINKSAMTVTVDDKKMGSHTLHVGESTKLKKGKDDATWADLKVGEEVHGVCVKAGEMYHAEKLMVSPQ